jgi:DNA polymerase
MVFGDGSPDSSIFFIGEGPGREEQEQGTPFVGRCGKLLRAMISAIGIPESDKYIANVVKDRPPNNRPPEDTEIEFCVKFLKKQIEIIDPKIIVLLGRTAVKGILPQYKDISLATLRKQSSILGSFTYSGIPVLVTYHPSALLRDSSKKVEAKKDFKMLEEAYKRLKNNEI